MIILDLDRTPTMLLIAWLAGIAAFAGGVLAALAGSARTTRSRELIHAVVALGGGILLAAVALALVPKAVKLLPPTALGLTFLGGGLVFAAVDRVVSGLGGSKAQFLAMVMDFVPEALSMGAVFATDRSLGLLLGVFIGAQNLPEGFNAFRELRSSGTSSKSTLMALATVSLAGPLAAWLGYSLLQDSPAVSAGIMNFASGGILYVIFQDIAPQSTMKNHWMPPLGAVFGFLIGMLGHQWLPR